MSLQATKKYKQGKKLEEAQGNIWINKRCLRTHDPIETIDVHVVLTIVGSNHIVHRVIFNSI